VGDVRLALAELGAGHFDYLVNNAGMSLYKAFYPTQPMNDLIRRAMNSNR
jgi:NAD(P)-dependent dehydrogenase (short-subunit alcohol dehydrogenase family)